MTDRHIRYPSTDQFRHAVKALIDRYQYAGKSETGEAIFDRSIPLPKIGFRGTVKIHGANAAIVFGPNGQGPYFQSRERIVTPEDDLHGFARTFTNLLTPQVLEKFPFLEQWNAGTNDRYICFYGEWCGPKIQAGVGVNKLDRPIFVVFGVKIVVPATDDQEDAVHWVPVPSSFEATGVGYLLYSIDQFSTYDVEIDLANPTASLDIIQQLTEQVGRECPVAKYFGIQGEGEGIVWKAVNTAAPAMFKSKCEAHAVTKSRQVAEIDPAELDKVVRFVEATITENRLIQALSYLTEQRSLPVDYSSLGTFLSWLVGDVIREESDLITELNLDRRQLNKQISAVGRKWLINKIESTV